MRGRRSSPAPSIPLATVASYETAISSAVQILERDAKRAARHHEPMTERTRRDQADRLRSLLSLIGGER